MSSEINIDELENEDLTEDDKFQQKLNHTKKHSSKKFILCPTLIVATVIFAVTILFFTGWKCFFDDSIVGATWTASYEIASTDSDTNKQETKVERYSFIFKENNVVEYHYGGMTTNGRYILSTNDDGTQQVQVAITNAGYPYINAYFDYSVSGNIFTGRTLSLVDKSGLLFAPESSDEESKINNKSTTVDEVRYYICDFKESGYEDEIWYYDDFKTDEKIIGSWLYEYDDYRCTYSFYDNGSFEMLTSDADIKGGYTVNEGKVKLRYYYISPVSEENEFESELEYSVDGDTLKLTSGESSTEFTKTTSKYDYKQDVQ